MDASQLVVFMHGLMHTINDDDLVAFIEDWSGTDTEVSGEKSMCMYVYVLASAKHIEINQHAVPSSYRTSSAIHVCMHSQLQRLKIMALSIKQHSKLTNYLGYQLTNQLYVIHRSEVRCESCLTYGARVDRLLCCLGFPSSSLEDSFKTLNNVLRTNDCRFQVSDIKDTPHTDTDKHTYIQGV